MGEKTSALDGSYWSTSHPYRFIIGERGPGTYWIGAGLAPDPVRTLWRRENPQTLPGIKPVFILGILVCTTSEIVLIQCLNQLLVFI
jgi:hypothetical protein